MKPHSVSYTRKWKKFFAVGCSHGQLADKNALWAALRFKELWNPVTTIHLGDFIDTTAFRSGAKGTADEAAPVDPDLESGLDFIEKLHPQLVICGNHEDRVFRLVNHPNAIVAKAAESVVSDIVDTCAKLKAELVPYGYKEFRTLGDCKFFHGTLFNEQCTRDHAEAFGNCIFAHAHRAGIAYGRRFDNPFGICVGTLMDVARAEYAKAKRSTLGWSQGFAWGEYCDDRTVAWLHVQPQNQKEWVLPL